MTLRIERVPLEVVVPTRMRELDPPRSWQEAVSPGDLESESVHLAAYDGLVIVGVASVGPQPLPVTGRPAARFRGVAVVRSRRGAGIGGLLTDALCERSRAIADVAWLYAKDRLTGFYTRHGFVPTEHVFVHPNGGRVRLFVNDNADGARAAALGHERCVTS